GALPGGLLQSTGGATRPARAGLVRYWFASASHRARKSAPIDENILACDVAGLSRAHERADCPNFVRATQPPRGDGCDALSVGLLQGNALTLGVRGKIGLETLRLELAG